jgi:hypothetical protein
MYEVFDPRGGRAWVRTRWAWLARALAWWRGWDYDRSEGGDS